MDLLVMRFSSSPFAPDGTVCFHSLWWQPVPKAVYLPCKNCLVTISYKFIHVSLSAHTSTIEGSGEQYLCIQLTIAFMFCKPLS